MLKTFGIGDAAEWIGEPEKRLIMAMIIWSIRDLKSGHLEEVQWLRDEAPFFLDFIGLGYLSRRIEHVIAKKCPDPSLVKGEREDVDFDRSKRPRPIEGECLVCGAPISQASNMGRPKKYCSVNHNNVAYFLRKKGIAPEDYYKHYTPRGA